LFFKNNDVFLPKNVRGTQGASSQNGQISFTGKYEQPKLTVSHARRVVDTACLISEFPHGAQLRTLLVHQNARYVYAKMAVATSCCTTTQLLLSHVRPPPPSWQ